MAFTCPRCRRIGTLAITHRLELPPDARSDEITLQVVRCAQCGFEALAVYEESRRGALDSESWSHTGYETDQAGVRAFKRAVRSCPSRGDPRCSCAAHEAYGQRDAGGRWAGLALFELGSSFPMIRS